MPTMTQAKRRGIAESCKYWPWGVAEKADWDMWPPRFFWRWLIKRMDRTHGWKHMDYDYD